MPDLEVDDPDGDAELLVLGWGSDATAPSARPAGGPGATGVKVAHAHLRHLNPFPANLGEVLRRYDTVVVPEMNLGQLSPCCCAASTWSDIQGSTKSAGMPFKSTELVAAITDAIKSL